MRHPSRRSVLRTAVGATLAPAIAGCAWDGREDTVTATGEGSADAGSDSAAGGSGGTPTGIPGVEDGEIVDAYALAHAHGDRLAARSGTLQWVVAALDRKYGDAEHHTRSTVRVEGARVHAVTAGGMFWDDAVDRSEFYTGEGSTIFRRTRTDGQWDANSFEPDQTSISKSDYTGTGRLETVTATGAGTETVDGETLQLFSRTARSSEDERVAWISTRLLVDDGGLVHRFEHSKDSLERGVRLLEEWYATDLDATTVTPPEWVLEYQD